MNLFKPREVHISPFWVLLALAVLIALFFIISQLGFLAGSVKHMKEQTASLSESVDELENYAGLPEENIALKTALRKSEEQ